MTTPPDPTWIWHLDDHLYHAFVFPEDRERGALVVSACGAHVQRSGETKIPGAPYCLDCAEALKMDLTDDEICPRRGLGYRRRKSLDEACSYCQQEKRPWSDAAGMTPSGLVAPQSAIDAMKKRGGATP